MPGLVPNPFPACVKKGLVKTLGSHFLVLDCGPIRLQNCGHMIMWGPCLCACTWPMHMVLKWWLVSFMHTGIANYCIPAGHVSVTLLTRPSLFFVQEGLALRQLLCLTWLFFSSFTHQTARESTTVGNGRHLEMLGSRYQPFEGRGDSTVYPMHNIDMHSTCTYIM